MKIFTTSQVSELDQYTVSNEPISAVDLMERASQQFADKITDNFSAQTKVAFFAGPGNNGGDALAIARILAWSGFRSDVFIPDFSKNPTDCFLINLKRLDTVKEFVTINNCQPGAFPDLSGYDLILDGLIGSGLTRPLTGFPADLVRHINNGGTEIISIDIPSGLMGEDNTHNDLTAIIKASRTYTFQFPKLSFLFSEHEIFTGKWEVLPIGLHPNGILEKKTAFFYSDLNTVAALLKPRRIFSHKGTYGHTLLVSGSYGKMGAAVLAAKGCLRSGAGLVTVHVPHTGVTILQTSLPEAILSIDASDKEISEIPLDPKYKTIGIGPGIGRSELTINAFRLLLEKFRQPIVIDADAINILAACPAFLELLPEGSVLTPHPLEFERLTGKSNSGYQRWQKALEFARLHNVILILKGAYSAILLPNGISWFNSTGNPGMATAGSGDVLTGIITSLLAQGYTSEEAAILGVYLHGLAGDLAVSSGSEESLLAGDLIENLGNAFRYIKNDPGFGNPKKRNNFE